MCVSNECYSPLFVVVLIVVFLIVVVVARVVAVILVEDMHAVSPLIRPSICVLSALEFLQLHHLCPRP